MVTHYYKYIKTSAFFLMLLICSMLSSSCMEEEMPTDQITDEQITNDVKTQQYLLNGISAYLVKYNAWGSSGYYYNDWGYPCAMLYRDICTQDFVYSKNGTLSYWSYKENGQSVGYDCYQWNYYYHLIKNCNTLISLIPPTTASDESKSILAKALVFRAMAYLDLARMYEYKKIGHYDNHDKKDSNGVVIASFQPDDYATKNGIWGLTVPIVTGDMSIDDIKNNPRAPFGTMYRFILTDLNRAVEYLPKNYTSADKSFPDIYVAYGLLARTWLEIGSRMDADIENAKEIDYYKLIKENDALDNGYDKLNVQNAEDCYKKAAGYADEVITKGRYTMLTRQQWTDKTSGFNSASSNNSWMWRCRIGDIALEPSYWFSFPGTVCSEPLNGLPYSYSAYRCISNTLYNKINDNDWRKLSWVSPEDAGKTTSDNVTKYNSLLDSTQFGKLDAYANLKFRPGSGDIETPQTWMIGDLPLMRVEEMYFIKAEAEARMNNVAKGIEILSAFMANRYKSGSYTYPGYSNINSFINELMTQKSIEFWGEGITFFDCKRLNRRINRKDVTNTISDYQISSKEGYCAPWLNMFIDTQETDRNDACKPNPDTAGYSE